MFLYSLRKSRRLLEVEASVHDFGKKKKNLQLPRNTTANSIGNDVIMLPCQYNPGRNNNVLPFSDTAVVTILSYLC